MRLGPALDAAPGWRPVTEDLYEIAERVREYDDLALLVRDDAGRLGLARYIEQWPGRPGGAYVLARECIDRTNGGSPLSGVPDGRVLLDMQLSDGHRRIRGSFDSFVRRSRDERERARARKRRHELDETMEHAEKIAHLAYTKDFGWKPHMRVTKAVG